MKTYLFYIVLFITISASAQTNHILSIKVYEKNLSKAVKKAKVEVEFEKGFEVKNTDSEGECNFILNKKNRAITPGEEIKITVHKAGYQTKRFDYTIQKNADRLFLDLTKEPTISIIGYINDDEGNHVEGVKVSYLKDYSSQTLSDGFFQLNIPIRVIDETSSTLIFSLQKDGFPNERIKKVLPYGKRTVFIEHILERNDGFPRDKKKGKVYDYTEFEKMLWTIEDLNIDTPNSFCYKNNCKVFAYSRLYTWEAAKKACEKLGKGWRLPTQDEWKLIALSFGGFDSKGVSKSEGNAKEAFQKIMNSPFNPQNAGYKKANKYKYSLYGESSFYWTSTSFNKEDAIFFALSSNRLITSVKSKKNALSCRCIKELE